MSQYRVTVFHKGLLNRKKKKKKLPQRCCSALWDTLFTERTRSLCLQLPKLVPIAQTTHTQRKK